MPDVTIEVKDLSFSYKNKSILKHCNATFDKGNIYVVLGNNGVGKTTFFRCLIKQNDFYDNTVFVLGKDLRKIKDMDYAKITSYVMQQSSSENMEISVRDYLVQGRTPYLKPFSVPGKSEYSIAYDYAVKIGIESTLSYQLNQLSGGELQLVNIARALLRETPIIIMDEPLSALDLNNQMKVLNIILDLKNEGKTIILSSHNPNHALYLNADVLLMKNGTIKQLSNFQNNINANELSNIYGCNIEVFDINGKKVVTF